MEYPIRINKYLRDSNLSSRREADKLVEAGLVFINGKRAENGSKVNEKDKVTLKENKNNAKKLQYLAYYKPKGLPTQDEPKRKSVIAEWKSKGLYPVGRLDKESEGLLFLTNDGRFAREVLSDKTEWEKEYMVVVKEPFHSGIVKILAGGMDTIAFGKLRPMKAKTFTKNKISIILNYTVVSLKRVRIGGIRLGSLKPGETRALSIVL
jgi:23S rRNA pseudouridine2604 synthase